MIMADKMNRPVKRGLKGSSSPAILFLIRQNEDHAAAEARKSEII
jgi:hypothetical protein